MVFHHGRLTTMVVFHHGLRPWWSFTIRGVFHHGGLSSSGLSFIRGPQYYLCPISIQPAFVLHGSWTSTTCHITTWCVHWGAGTNLSLGQERLLSTGQFYQSLVGLGNKHSVNCHQQLSAGVKYNLRHLPPTAVSV